VIRLVFAMPQHPNWYAELEDETDSIATT